MLQDHSGNAQVFFQTLSYDQQENYVNIRMWMSFLLGNCLELIAGKLPRVTWPMSTRKSGSVSDDKDHRARCIPHHTLKTTERLTLSDFSTLEQLIVTPYMLMLYTGWSALGTANSFSKHEITHWGPTILEKTIGQERIINVGAVPSSDVVSVDLLQFENCIVLIRFQIW